MNFNENDFKNFINNNFIDESSIYISPILLMLNNEIISIDPITKKIIANCNGEYKEYLKNLQTQEINYNQLLIYKKLSEEKISHDNIKIIQGENFLISINKTRLDETFSIIINSIDYIRRKNIKKIVISGKEILETYQQINLDLIKLLLSFDNIYFLENSIIYMFETLHIIEPKINSIEDRPHLIEEINNKCIYKVINNYIYLTEEEFGQTYNRKRLVLKSDNCKLSCDGLLAQLKINNYEIHQINESIIYSLIVKCNLALRIIILDEICLNFIINFCNIQSKIFYLTNNKKNNINNSQKNINNQKKLTIIKLNSDNLDDPKIINDLSKYVFENI